MRLVPLCLCLVLAACGAPTPPPQPAQHSIAPLGAFRLGHNIVSARAVQPLNGSVLIAPEAWEQTLRNSVASRFAPLDGDQFYHLAIAVEAYSIAGRDAPPVTGERSVLVVSADIWDDAASAKITPSPQRFTITQDITALTGALDPQIKVAQMSEQAARQIEAWLRANPQWFLPR